MPPKVQYAEKLFEQFQDSFFTGISRQGRLVEIRIVEDPPTLDLPDPTGGAPTGALGPEYPGCRQHGENYQNR